MGDNEQLAEIVGAPLTNSTSLFSHLEQGLRKNPHKAAVLCMHQPANYLSDLVPADPDFQEPNGVQHGDCLVLTYTQLHRVALSLAAGMVANNVQPGSTILTLIPNGAEYNILLWTCTIMRLTLAAVDPSALDPSGQERLQSLIHTLKPGLVVVPDMTGAGAVDTALENSNLPQPLRISLVDDSCKSWKSFRNILADASRSSASESALLEAARNDDADRIHSIMFTSGTSAGQPKGCPMRVGSMTHILHSQSWLINGDNCAFVLEQAHNSRAVAPQTVLQTWREGGAVVMPSNGFAIEDTLDAITQHGATFVIFTPAMVHALLEKVSSRAGSLDSVRTVQVGGDAVTKDLLIKCAALFPRANICSNHGMTEGGGFFTWPFYDQPVTEIPYFGEICPIGTVAPGTQLRIWDADNRSVTKRGTPGELHVCCDSIIRHYLNGVSESSFYEDEKGHWFNTGDVAMIDDAGMVFIFGRSKDVIKRAGVAIMPAAIESCIEKYTGAQTSVVPVPHPKLGHEPFAVLSDINTKDENDIRSHVLRTFSEDYALRGLSSLKQIGLPNFPVNATHKVITFEVQKAVLEYLKQMSV